MNGLCPSLYGLEAAITRSLSPRVGCPAAHRPTAVKWHGVAVYNPTGRWPAARVATSNHARHGPTRPGPVLGSALPIISPQLMRLPPQSGKPGDHHHYYHLVTHRRNQLFWRNTVALEYFVKLVNTQCNKISKICHNSYILQSKTEKNCRHCEIQFHEIQTMHTSDGTKSKSTQRLNNFKWSEKILFLFPTIHP